MSLYIRSMYFYAIRCETLSKKILMNLQFREDEEGTQHDDGDEDAEEREKNRLDKLSQVRCIFSLSTILMDICFSVGCMMNLYLSMAINKVEKEEKKRHVYWKPPYNLHRNSLIK